MAIRDAPTEYGYHLTSKACHTTLGGDRPVLLSLEAISSGYDGIPIVRDVTLGVEQGEVVAVVGRNGVGKTTLVQTIVGLIAVAAGRISLAGEDVTSLDARDRVHRGIGYVPQGRGIFSRLSVGENLQMGELVGTPGGRHDYERVYDWFPILKERRKQKAGTLSGGEQQMLAIGRILIGDPVLLLLDEPSEGIQPSIVEQIADVTRALNEERGLTILLVEQNLDLVYVTADRCVVMDKGTIIDALSPEHLADPDTAKRYLAL
jgi:branched-chain amino acid transport system ATP-binding protein